jgi:hypothetical protein
MIYLMSKMFIRLIHQKPIGGIEYHDWDEFENQQQVLLPDCSDPAAVLLPACLPGQLSGISG